MSCITLAGMICIWTLSRWIVCNKWRDVLAKKTELAMFFYLRRKEKNSNTRCLSMCMFTCMWCLETFFCAYKISKQNFFFIMLKCNKSPIGSNKSVWYKTLTWLIHLELYASWKDFVKICKLLSIIVLMQCARCADMLKGTILVNISNLF